MPLLNRVGGCGCCLSWQLESCAQGLEASPRLLCGCVRDLQAAACLAWGSCPPLLPASPRSSNWSSGKGRCCCASSGLLNLLLEMHKKVVFPIRTSLPLAPEEQGEDHPGWKRPPRSANCLLSSVFLHVPPSIHPPCQPQAPLSHSCYCACHP